ncbi:hypothetical protein H5410_047008 [Solanum commersonii]|uniref:RNase H type-1 domain-containing protein n=1 Tax=Solanum commersonii TaxID=4109 RepID=A0A9J5XHF2_SOLCO|nr:hypothetical protein H5410_047008 [Solanum commersonii]
MANLEDKKLEEFQWKNLSNQLYIRRRRSQALVSAINSCDNLLQVFGIPIQYFEKGITVDAIAIRMTLEHVRKKGWTKVQVLSDAVVQRIIVSCEIETTCEDIWKLTRFFKEVNVMYILNS